MDDTGNIWSRQNWATHLLWLLTHASGETKTKCIQNTIPENLFSLGKELYFICCSYRMLYWADRGNDPKIECSWLDGQQRKVLVSEQLGWPTGLSIDYANNDRIYWSDSKESRIESVLPSGEGRRTAVFIGATRLSLEIIETAL